MVRTMLVSGISIGPILEIYVQSSSQIVTIDKPSHYITNIKSKTKYSARLISTSKLQKYINL